MLTVEDGSQVTNSNTWVSRADYIAYALTIGITIASNDTADVQLVKAGEYINQHEANLKGSLVDRDQSMSHPRDNLYIDGEYWDSDEIATKVKLCQMAYALNINGGEDLYNRSANSEKIVTKERVEGAVEVEYAAPANGGLPPTKLSTGDVLLGALLENNSMNIALVRA